MVQPREVPRARVRAGRFAVTFLLFLCCVGAWALAMPLFSAADEGAHMVKAYAVIHSVEGRLDPETGISYFQVPAVFAYGGHDDNPCYAFRPEVPADCMVVHEGGPTHEVGSSAAGYPPFFYLLVGWPSLFTSGTATLYLMRLCGAVLVALFMAMGVESVVRMRGRAPLLLGVAAAITPAVFYFGAMVNPSGLAIASAFAAWTGGIFIGRSERVEHLGWAAARVGLPLCVLMLLRRDSLFWGALIIAGLLALTPWARLRELVRSVAVWVWVAVLGACAVLQLLTSEGAGGSFAGSGGAASGSFWGAAIDANWILHQVQGGILGWLDVNLPFPVMYVFIVSSAFLIVSAIGFASRRVSLTVLAMSLAVVAIPLAIGTIRWPYFQGRYMLPLTVGLPVVAGLGVAEGLRDRLMPRRLLWLLLPLLALAQVASFAQALRRFVSGASADWWIFSSPRWEPPVGHPSGVVVFYGVAVVALFAWWYLLARTDAPIEEPPPV